MSEIDQSLIDRFQGEAISAEKEINEKVNKALNNPHAPKRWFWELLQNATDTISDSTESKINVQVEIKETTNGPILVFTHDGQPFKESAKKYRFDDFKNLINPTSGKVQQDDNTIGKFGTGFLSTHILSLKIQVRGLFQKLDGEQFPMSTVLDRTSFIDESEEARDSRIESLILALDAYEKSKGVSTNTQGFPTAEYTYFLNINNLSGSETTEEYVEKGLKEIKHSLPYVMAFNSKINSVKIKDHKNNQFITYSNYGSKEKLGDVLEIFQMEIKVEGENPEFDFVGVIKDEENQVDVSWKLRQSSHPTYRYDLVDSRAEYRDELGDQMSSLFCMYPLIGSHDFKFPLIVNSKRFKPNETRDGILLLNNDSHNHGLIEKAIEQFKSFISIGSEQFNNLYTICDTINNVLNGHAWIDKKWYDSQINSIRTKILTTPIITVNGNIEDERKSINDIHGNSQIRFPKLTLNGVLKPELDEEFYFFVSLLFAGNIPLYSELNFWKSILWESSKIEYLNIKDLIKSIEREQNLPVFSKRFTKNDEASDQNQEQQAIDWLIAFYDFLSEKLESLGLLENENIHVNNGIVLSRSKEFKSFRYLKKDTGYNGALIQEEIINIHASFYNLTESYSGRLLHHSLVKLIRVKDKDEITEESMAKMIHERAEEQIKRHDELLKLKNESTLTPAQSEEKVQIEQRLSDLQVWIGKYNGQRNYFNNYFKRKVLQAIIDEEKSESLTGLLELDRSGKVSLDKQITVLKDPELDDKLRLGAEFLEYQKEKEAQDEKNRERGRHFEQLFKDLMDENQIPCVERDGKQDFILYQNSPNQIYVELKSIFDSSKFVSLTPEQAKKAVEKNINYFICVIPNSGDFREFTKQNFKDKCLFNNQLKESLFKKLKHTEEFIIKEDGVAGEFPNIVLHRLRTKPYYLKVEDAVWGDVNFEKFIEKVKSGNLT